MAREKKLYKKRDDKFIAGVCSGLADYFDIDPTIMRLGFVLLTFATYGLMIVIYLCLWLVLPSDEPNQSVKIKTKRRDYSKDDYSYETYENGKREKRKSKKEKSIDGEDEGNKSHSTLGIILIVVGLIIFARHIIPSNILDNFIIPVCLLLGGICLLLTSLLKREKEEYYVEPSEEEIYSRSQESFVSKEEVNEYTYEEVKVEDDIQEDSDNGSFEIGYEAEPNNDNSFKEDETEIEETPDVIVLSYESDGSDMEEVRDESNTETIVPQEELEIEAEVDTTEVGETEIEIATEEIEVAEEVKDIEDNINKTYIDITSHQLNKEDNVSQEVGFEKGEGEEDE